jgi:hypothetical protein
MMMMALATWCSITDMRRHFSAIIVAEENWGFVKKFLLVVENTYTSQN